MKPTKASRERHEKFRARISKMLTFAGATLVEDTDLVRKFILPNKRIADLEFTMFKRDGEEGRRPKQEFYCLFIRIVIDAPDFARHVAEVNKNYWNEMGPSGKWNIMHSDPQDIYNELTKRLTWLTS